MPNDQGPQFFEYGFVDAPFYVDGRSFSVFNGPNGISWEQPPTAYMRQTLAGTHRVIRPWVASGAPNCRAPLNFSVALKIAAQADYHALLTAEARGETVYVVPLIRVVEVFQVVSGSNYRLSRPVASDVVAGLPAEEYASILELDGVVTPDAATISGRTITAAATGELVVEYTPALACLVTLSHTYSRSNELLVSVSFSEGIEP